MTKIAFVWFVNNEKYKVIFPDSRTAYFVSLDEVALECDKFQWELYYKGKKYD